MRRQLVGLLVIAALLSGLAAANDSTVRASDQARSMPDGKVVVRKIKRYQRVTWRWQRLMGVRRTPNRKRYLRIRDLGYRRHVLRQWLPGGTRTIPTGAGSRWTERSCACTRPAICSAAAGRTPGRPSSRCGSPSAHWGRVGASTPGRIPPAYAA